jgi:hypothetical protein
MHGQADMMMALAQAKIRERHVEADRGRLVALARANRVASVVARRRVPRPAHCGEPLAAGQLRKPQPPDAPLKRAA